MLLLKNYCDPNVEAKNGTPLSIAKKEGKSEIVSLLEATEEEFMEKSTYEAFQGTKENLFVREGSFLFKWLVSFWQFWFCLIAAKFQEQNEQDFSQKIQIEKSHWYYGEINRVDAESILEACGTNSFLVRTSSVPGRFALSQFDAKADKFIHFLIVPEPSGGFKIENSDDSNVYPSMDDLIFRSPILKGFQAAGIGKTGTQFFNTNSQVQFSTRDLADLSVLNKWNM